jgi:very-short-patch-repair endonuclease
MSNHRPSPLEWKFALCWQAVHGPDLVHEYRFNPDRRWRFDFAHPASKVAIEIEGGTWVAGSHGRGARYGTDCEKYNAALLAGWQVFRLTTDMVGTAWAQTILKHIATVCYKASGDTDATKMPLDPSKCVKSPTAAQGRPFAEGFRP